MVLNFKKQDKKKTKDGKKIHRNTHIVKLQSLRK